MWISIEADEFSLLWPCSSPDLSIFGLTQKSYHADTQKPTLMMHHRKDISCIQRAWNFLLNLTAELRMYLGGGSLKTVILLCTHSFWVTCLSEKNTTTNITCFGFPMQSTFITQVLRLQLMHSCNLRLCTLSCSWPRSNSYVFVCYSYKCGEKPIGWKKPYKIVIQHECWKHDGCRLISPCAVMFVVELVIGISWSQ